MRTLQPLVSILMTSYNREKYIAEAIESVLNSSYQNFELIIVDDGSKDRTVEIAQVYAKDDSRVKIYINEQNLGDYPNRNKAASYAKGEFMTYVDSDDKFLPDTIDKILYNDKLVGELNFAMYWPHSTETFILEGSAAIQKHFFDKQFLYMGPGGTFMRRSFFNSIGKYPEKYGPANDMYFNLKACCASAIHLFPFEFIFYRIHEGQEINNRYSYLYNSFNYMRDALLELNLGLSKQQTDFLTVKNKRRFIVNLVQYLFRTLNIRKTIQAWKNAEFSFADFLKGVFH